MKSFWKKFLVEDWVVTFLAIPLLVIAGFAGTFTEIKDVVKVPDTKILYDKIIELVSAPKAEDAAEQSKDLSYTETATTAEPAAESKGEVATTTDVPAPEPEPEPEPEEVAPVEEKSMLAEIRAYFDGVDPAVKSLMNIGALFLIALVILYVGNRLLSRPLRGLFWSFVVVFSLALLAQLVAKIPIIKQFGFEAVFFSVIFGLIVRNCFHIPEWLKLLTTK